MAKKTGTKPTAKVKTVSKPQRAQKKPLVVVKTTSKTKAKPLAVVQKAAAVATKVVKVITSKVVAAERKVAASTKKTAAVPDSKSPAKMVARPGTVLLMPAVKSSSTLLNGTSKTAKPIKIKKFKSKVKVDDTPVRLPPPPVTSDSKMAKNRAGLGSRELEYFRDLLLSKRRELLGDVTSMERDALRSGTTNLSNLPLHMADTGTDNYEQEFTLGLVEKDRQLLREINTALAKIQDGSFGVCEGTGKPISKPRLEAQPWARYSIEYARQLEKPQYRRAY